MSRTLTRCIAHFIDQQRANAQLGALATPNGVYDQDNDEFVTVTRIGTVLADEITMSPNHTAGYALRFPRVNRFRDADKRPEDATTLEELVELYQQQAGRTIE